MADNPVEIPELPSEQAIDRLVSLLEPYRRITQPKFYGIENLPDDGSLLVGNHTIYGFLDLPFMMAEVWKRRRILVRGLGEDAHYAVPVWRDFLRACGMVRGTRDNVRALMRDHQTILVFPGGCLTSSRTVRAAVSGRGMGVSPTPRTTGGTGKPVAELARRAGTSQAMVARYETGAASPTVRTLRRLLRAAGRELVLSGPPASPEESPGRPVDVAAPLVFTLVACSQRRRTVWSVSLA